MDTKTKIMNTNIHFFSSGSIYIYLAQNNFLAINVYIAKNDGLINIEV